jgi:hypothetical protein
LDSWVELRAGITGEAHTSDTRVVRREVDRVLAAMRERPQWYQDHVERPLGAKTPPLAPTFTTNGKVAEPPELVLTTPADTIDFRLTDLAALALCAIEDQLVAGPCDDTAIGRIIAAVFGRLDSDAALAQAPDALGGRGIGALVDDPVQLDRIVSVVREILESDKQAVS